ncbi:hypothetical protein MASR2M17_08700 [Aminivibrio sp.]
MQPHWQWAQAVCWTRKSRANRSPDMASAPSKVLAEIPGGKPPEKGERADIGGRSAAGGVPHHPAAGVHAAEASDTLIAVYNPQIFYVYGYTTSFCKASIIPCLFSPVN